MTLEKALELSKEAEKSLRKGKFPHHADAVKMGIEAMERTHTRREHLSWKNEPLLPGETVE